MHQSRRLNRRCPTTALSSSMCASQVIVRRDRTEGRWRHRTDVPAAQEMRVGPSGSDGRVRAQTTWSCFGTMAEVVSVQGKGGTKPVR